MESLFSNRGSGNAKYFFFNCDPSGQYLIGFWITASSSLNGGWKGEGGFKAVLKPQE